MLYIIFLSHIGYLGIFIEIIWNYIPTFFVILEFYNFYSNFICISSILNNRLEKVFAFVIIYLAYLIQKLVSSLFISSMLLNDESPLMQIYRLNPDVQKI